MIHQQRHSSGDALADRRADYAKGLAAEGDHRAAADLMRQALERVPGWAAGLTVLGLYLAEAGLADEAADALGEALRLDPADPFGAGLKLAALGRAEVPQTAPPAFVRGLFDQYAERFESALLGTLAYRAPEHLTAAIRAVVGPAPRFAAALDLGCGTGLMGERLRPLSDRLDGVDLSPAMLAEARRKAIYDDLAEADILDLDPQGRAYDLVAAADVFNYVGDLAPVFAGLAPACRPGALLAFTLEASAGPEPYRLGESLRYAHFAPAVEVLLRNAGWTLRHRAEATLREDRGVPVAGLVFVAAFAAS